MVIDRAYLGFGGDTLSRKRLEKLREACGERVQSALLPALSARFAASLPRKEAQTAWTLELAPKDEDPDQQTLLFRYPSEFPGDAGYVQPVVRIEMGARSDTEPVESPVIQPLLADVFPDLFKGGAFPVRTVAPRRTFWEKAMLLHEETYRPSDKPLKPRLSRHYYDLWCLIRHGIAGQAVGDDGLFDRIAAHRRIFFRQTWLDYSTLAKGQLRLAPLPEQEARWRKDYNAMSGEMFFGEPPPFDDVLNAVRDFETEFNQP